MPLVYALAAVGIVALIIIGVPGLIWWLDMRAARKWKE